MNRFKHIPIKTKKRKKKSSLREMVRKKGKRSDPKQVVIKLKNYWRKIDAQRKAKDKLKKEEPEVGKVQNSLERALRRRNNPISLV